jgi:predicted phage-related endonuclease
MNLQIERINKNMKNFTSQDFEIIIYSLSQQIKVFQDNIKEIENTLSQDQLNNVFYQLADILTFNKINMIKFYKLEIDRILSIMEKLNKERNF